MLILLKRVVEESSTRSEGAGERERQSESMLTCLWKGPWKSLATNA